MSCVKFIARDICEGKRDAGIEKPVSNFDFISFFGGVVGGVGVGWGVKCVNHKMLAASPAPPII